MDFLFFDELQRKPYLIPALIVASSIATLLLNVYGLRLGITNVLPHLLYIPIILTAYYYPRRGVLFAAGLSVCYCAVSFTVVSPTTVEMLSAIARSGVFLVIAGVVSYLSGRMHHDTQICRRLVSVVRSSGDAIIGETPDGTVSDWNVGAERLYGYTSREMVGSPILRLVPPEHREERRLLLEKIRQGEMVEHVETERITKDGRRIQVSLSLSPIQSNTGDIIGVSDIAHDITDRQRFQDEILKAKDRWELTFDAVPDMIAIIDDHFRIVQVNKAMADRLGVSPEDAVGLTCYEVVHHSSNPPSICPHQKLLRDGQNHSTDIHEDTLNGDFFLTVSPIRDHSGAVLGSVHILRDISERKQAEKQMQESEKKYRSIFNTFPDLYYRTDLNGVITTLSPSVKRLSGWAPEDLIGHPVCELYPFPEQRAGLLETLVRTGEVHGYEVTLQHRDRRHIQTSVSCHLVYDDAGEPAAVEGTIRDINEKKKMEVALQESEAKFREIFNAANDAIHLHEIDGRGLSGKFIDVNEVACHMLRYSREELLEKSPLDLMTDYHSRPPEEIREEITTKGSAIFETEHQRKDGVIIPVEVSTHIVAIQGKKMVLSIIRNLTRRKQDEAAFRQLSADHKAIIDHAPAMIWYKDTKNTFIRVNPAGAQAFGMPIEEIEGKSASVLFPDLAEKYYRDDLDVINSGRPRIGIIEQMITAGGEHLWVQTDKIPLRDEEGTITGLLLFIVDITERKHAEDALALASKKLNLLSSVTRHDILNQLTALKGYIELSREEPDEQTLAKFISTEEKIVDTLERQINFTREYQDLGVNAPVWQTYMRTWRRR